MNDLNDLMINIQHNFLEGSNSVSSVLPYINLI